MTRIRPTVRLAAAALGALALLAAGCGSSQDTPASDTRAATISVVASTNVYGSIAAAVGGDRVTVDALINDPSADPHSYESTPADAAKVQRAKIVIANGGGYDDFVPKLVTASGAKPTTIDVSELSGLKPAASGKPAADEEHAHGHGDGHGQFNEHVWYSLATMRKLADKIATELGAADPAGAAAYRANAGAFTGKLDGLQTKVDAIKARHTGQRVAITEPVPGYLVEAAGLVDATPEAFADAVERDTDPPAAVLNETLRLFTAADKVRALVANAQTENASTKQVAQAATTAGVPIVRMTETLPSGVGDYVSWMDRQIGELSAALDRR